MMRPRLSAAAAGLLRALMARSQLDRDRIILTNFRSVDWYSLTFSGERHEISLRLLPPDVAAMVARLAGGLGNVEWHVPGQIVADIAVLGEPAPQADGSVLLNLEALTIAE